MKNASLDMGKDRVARVIVMMAVPAMLSMFFQNLYEFVDTMFISWLGAVPLAAQGLSMPLFYVALALAKAVQYGLIGLAGGARGAGDHFRAEEILQAGQFLIILLMLPLLIVAFPTAGRVFYSLMGASGDLLEQAYIYSFWLVLSFPVMAYFMLGEAMLVSRGDTRTPMRAMVGGNLINLVLDPILMFGLDMGIAGAAVATLAGWLLAVAILLSRLNRLELAMPSLRWNRAYFGEWREMAGQASFIFTAQISSPLALALVNSILVQFGAAAVGAWTIMSRLELFSLMPLFGVGSALIAFTSYNAAAGNYQRIREGLWKAALVSGVFVLPIMVFFIFWPEIAVWPFQAGDEVRGLAAGAIRIAAWAHIVCPLELILFGLAQGLRKPVFYLPAVIVRLFVLRYPLAYVLAGLYGLAGVYWSQPLANLGTAIVSGFLIIHLVKPLRSLNQPGLTATSANKHKEVSG